MTKEEMGKIKVFKPVLVVCCQGMPLVDNQPLGGKFYFMHVHRQPGRAMGEIETIPRQY